MPRTALFTRLAALQEPRSPELEKKFDQLDQTLAANKPPSTIGFTLPAELTQQIKAQTEVLQKIGALLDKPPSGVTVGLAAAEKQSLKLIPERLEPVQTVFERLLLILDSPVVKRYLMRLDAGPATLSHNAHAVLAFTQQARNALLDKEPSNAVQQLRKLTAPTSKGGLPAPYDACYAVLAAARHDELREELAGLTETAKLEQLAKPAKNNEQARLAYQAELDRRAIRMIDFEWKAVATIDDSPAQQSGSAAV